MRGTCWLLIAFCTAGSAGAGVHPQTPTGPGQVPTDRAAETVTVKVGVDDESVKPLRELINSGLAAARAGDQAKLKEIAASLTIPEYELWFKAIFGDDLGSTLAESYGMRFAGAEASYLKLFDWLGQQKGELVIEDASTLPKRTDSWCGQTLVDKAKGNAVFYRVSMVTTDPLGLRTARTAGYFTLVSGAYRRLDCQMLGLQLGGPGPRLVGPIRVGGNVQKAKLLNTVPPVYPQLARQARISGTVRLHAIIGTDGTIKQLEVISGHPLLQQAALDAVRQWRYQQTLLNGEPVEVDTTIDMIFSLMP